MYNEIPGYDPADFDEYDDLDQIRTRLGELDPSTDSAYELAHLNREAARIIEESESKHWEIALDRLSHTFYKDIKTAATWHINDERVGAFREGIKHTLLDILGM